MHPHDDDSKHLDIRDARVARATPSQRAKCDAGNDRNTEQTKDGDSPMRSTKQTRFFVLVRDGTHVPAHNFEIGILACIVDCHLEHAEVKVGDRTEGPACDQYDGLLFWMALKEIEAVVRKRIVRR